MKKILSLTLLFLFLISLLSVTGQAEELPYEAPLDVMDAEALPFTAALNEFFTQNGGTLLGFLTFIGSLLVAFLYKTGLLPMLRSGLSALRELLSKNSDMTEGFTKEASALFARMEEKAEKIPTMLEKTESSLLALEERLAALEAALRASENDRQNTAEVLRTETELFYEMLASVNLPEAQKESMTESYYRMKKKLEAGS